jgi:hypothetical protein
MKKIIHNSIYIDIYILKIHYVPIIPCFKMKGYVLNNRVIYKLRKTQHQNPKFGHTQGEFFFKTCKKIH